VGYVGGNFAEHSAAYAYQPIITGHSDAVVAYCYSTWQEDHATERFRPHVVWRDCRNQAPAQVLKRVLADQIDVLVDLAGHTAGGMLPVFAQRAAPIQVTAWGYALTTGLPEMDVLFTEKTFCPPNFQWISERQRIYLPALIPQQPPEGAPPLQPRAPGPIRFGYGGSPAKLNPIVLHRWGELLRAVPDATLECQYLGFEQPGVQAMLIQEMQIDPRRVTFGPMMSHHEHLERVVEWDVALDSWPHTGGVTTLDMAMCGVPSLTLCQDEGVMASRTSSSLMRTMGLGGWVMPTPEAWVQRGSIVDPERIDKRAIRAAFENSPVRDIPAYVQAVEGAYRALWTDWCSRPRR
jgi:predicted O-linked N-acetylglucosamine transferase (SPINDLY family)